MCKVRGMLPIDDLDWLAYIRRFAFRPPIGVASLAIALSPLSPTMYAIIAADGKQYKVQQGDEIQVDLRTDVKEGDTIQFDQVLLVSDGTSPKVGKPTVAGASVAAEVLGQEQGDKIYIQKMRRRKNYRRRTGHRQMYTRVRIGAISG